MSLQSTGCRIKTYVSESSWLHSLLFVIFATLIISVFYLTVESVRGLLILPFDRIPFHGPAYIKHFPWTDMGENVSIGFNLANGFRFEHDTVVNHMPGIYQYLAMFFKISGVYAGTPSVGLASACYAIAAVAVTLFELTLLFLTLRILGFAFFPAAVTSSALLGVCALLYDIIFPMSENVIPFIFMLQYVCFLKILLPQEIASKKYTYAAWGLTFLPFINLLAGLTVAPSVAFLWGLTAVAFLWEIKNGTLTLFREEIKKIELWIPLILTFILLIVEASILDLKALLFWNYGVNKEIGISPFAAMKDAFAAQWHWDFVGHHWHMIGGTILELIIAFLVFFYVAKEKDRKAFIHMWILFVVALIAMWLSTWRLNIAYKSEVIFGATWVFLFMAALAYWPSIKESTKKVPLRALSILASCAFVMLVSYLTTINIGRHTLPSRVAALDAANVCRLRSTDACRCLQSTVFGPQVFLEQDMRQCADRYATFASEIFKNSEVRARLTADIDRHDVAFLVYPVEMFGVDEKDRDPSVIHAFYEGGMHCEFYAGPAKICYNP